MARGFFLLLYVLQPWLSIARAQESSVLLLEPVVVESLREPRALLPQKNVSIAVGEGASDLPLYSQNEFGVHLQSMEYEVDISSSRRQSEYFLPGDFHSHWQTQIQTQVSRAEALRARTFGYLDSRNKMEFEAGFTRDYGRIYFLDNRNTPYDNRDDVKNSFSPHLFSQFFRVRWQRAAWTALTDFDRRENDVYAGPINTGRKKANRWEGDLSYAGENFTLTGFGSTEEHGFSSHYASLLSNYTSAYNLGTLGTFALPPSSKLSLEVHNEQLHRDKTALLQEKFTRFSAKVTAASEFIVGRIFEANGFLDYFWAQDKSSLRDQNFQLWDAGAEISSTRKISLGAQAKALRYALAPKPSNIFGDGVLLLPNPSLPLESGTRFSVGPWYRVPETLALEASFFGEDVKNAPIILAASPASAKAYAIGGVWTRGLQVKADIFLKRWSLSSEYVYQSALNASSINWQRGRKVPGRPEQLAKTTLKYNSRHWETGITHEYRSAETLDLAGILSKPTRHKFGSFMGYREKTWLFQLTGKNLLARELNVLQFEGTAGQNVLEPELDQREILFTAEVLL